jgi:hypothetical protein
MKTVILKFKASFLVAILACLGPVQSYSIVNVEDLSKNEFFEVMIDRIKSDVVEAVFDLLKVLTTKDLLAKETYDSVIKRCQERLEIITKQILSPIKSKLDIVKHTQPDSRFTVILEKINKLANELAYRELNNLISVLKAHKTDADARKTTAFIGKLKKYFAKFTPTAPSCPSPLVKDLEDQLKVIYNLIKEEQLSVVEKLNKDEIVADIKNKFLIIEANFKSASLLSAWSNLLKTI